MVRLGRHRPEDRLRAGLPAARYLALAAPGRQHHLPVGVEAYAAYTLRVWLASEYAVSARFRRFAKWSAIFSFALGMVGQVAYHLLAQPGAARAPWPVTTIVSCLPVLVLGMGTALAHMMRADAGTAAEPPGNRTPGPAATPRSSAWSFKDQAGPAQDQAAPRAPLAASGPSAGTRTAPKQDHDAWAATPTLSGIGQARQAAGRLTAAGKPVSRRTLRSEGIRGSNQALNALAGMINAELAGAAALRPDPATLRRYPAQAPLRLAAQAGGIIRRDANGRPRPAADRQTKARFTVCRRKS
jgi:hypothetical protein